jgi:hypothetical protein
MLSVKSNEDYVHETAYLRPQNYMMSARVDNTRIEKLDKSFTALLHVSTPPQACSQNFIAQATTSDLG